MLGVIFLCACVSYICYPWIYLAKVRLLDADDGSPGKSAQVLRIHQLLYVTIFLLPWVIPVSLTASLILCVVAVVIALYVFRRLCEPRLPPHLQSQSLRGLTILLTGANRGVGLGTATALARRGCRVVISCRKAEVAQQTCVQIQSRVPDALVEAVPVGLDFEDPEGVIQAARVVRETWPHLDGILLNAGVGHRNVCKKREDKVDSIIFVNCLSPCLFLRELEPCLAKSAQPCVLMTSSVVGRSFFTEFPNAEDLLYDWTHENPDTLVCYGGYGRSKALQALYIQHWAQAHPRVRAFSFHPGTVNTDMPLTIWSQLGKWYPENLHYIMYPIFAKGLSTIWMDPETSGLVVLNALLNTDLPSGAMLTAASLKPYQGQLVKNQEEHAKRVHDKVNEYLGQYGK